MSNKKIHLVTFLLLVVGGINWLLLGLFSWEIGTIFGGPSAAVSKIIYIIFGLAAVYELFTHKNSCRSCASPNGVGAAHPPIGEFK